MDFLEALNTQQKEAVTHNHGPLLVIAGAGSGKTRVLTYRIAYLIGHFQVRPHEILAVTFTNKAAEEMKDRISKIVGSVAQEIWVSTFHSTCVRILRRNADKLGYEKNFHIFDSSDQLVVIKDCLKELNLDPKKFEPRAMVGSISKAKNDLLTPKKFSAQASEFWDKQVARVYQLYQQKLRTNNAFDFDDLIMKTVELLQEDSQVLEYYQNRFRYILVDEYQDTNHAQYELVNLLAQKSQNLCVVGDDDQSIYAFRGADIRNILEFEHDYPEVKTIRLEENYRSTQNILEAANHVIANNTTRKGKTLYTRNGDGPKLKFHQAADERQEAAYIGAVIQAEVRDSGRNYHDFTIMYRTHAQSRTIEEEFIRRGIPYRIVAGLRFYDRKEIKDLLAYLRLIANPFDNYSFRRIVNVPKRGIGDTTVGKLEDYANSNGESLLSALDKVEEISSITGKYRKTLIEFRTLIQRLRIKAESSKLTTIAEDVLQETGYKQALLAQKSIEADSRIENLNEFLTVTQQYDVTGDTNDLGEFLEKITLMSDVDNYDQDANVISLMTFHAAKGLEFPVAFLVGMEDGVFPSARSLWEPGQIEEERRLAYVGLTRAEEQVYLTCARRRTLFGNVSENPVSTFIKEIPEQLLDLEEAPGLNNSIGIRSNTLSTGLADQWLAKPNAKNDLVFNVGDKVHHQHFGKGMVVSISGDILSIAFDDQEIKKFSQGLAPLKKI